MSLKIKIYIILCSIFSSLVIMSNLIYRKFVILDIPLIYKFEISAGAVLYPVSFIVTDLITECFGKEKASFCVRLAVCMNIMVSVFIALVNYLPATSWSSLANAEFTKAFGFYSVSFLGSMVACYLAQIADIHLFLWIRKTTKGKFLWLRSSGSTCISLFIDTFVVVSILTFFGILPTEQALPLIYNSYLWKLFSTIASIPVFYAGVYVLRRKIK